MLRRFLVDSQSEQLTDVAELVLSELVTNAVAHARVPGRLIAVRLELLGGELRIEVHDASSDRPVLLPWPDDDIESGRGLRLVQTLSNAWGCCPRRGLGKFVWAVCGTGGGA